MDSLTAPPPLTSRYWKWVKRSPLRKIKFAGEGSLVGWGLGDFSLETRLQELPCRLLAATLLAGFARAPPGSAVADGEGLAWARPGPSNPPAAPRWRAGADIRAGLPASPAAHKMLAIAARRAWRLLAAAPRIAGSIYSPPPPPHTPRPHPFPTHLCPLTCFAERRNNCRCVL